MTDLDGLTLKISVEDRHDGGLSVTGTDVESGETYVLISKPGISKYIEADTDERLRKLEWQMAFVLEDIAMLTERTKGVGQ
ncbi:hypothetical protein [Peribacillus huizhouensis]|uniref:Uncharacterized protein n=1 Tax=Peribacillus huizhouensis TaxID=1501239 RepID=A0ABR6CR80_9BACI|nr:hypothetical protein [Peribacillus huizhouensis]MBA9027543.1 hypothetical protein [Peribacillus huizhouensis]